MPLCIQSLKLLSVIAVIRLDNNNDDVEKTLAVALLDSAKSGITNRSITASDPLASSSWEKVKLFFSFSFLKV